MDEAMFAPLRADEMVRPVGGDEHFTAPAKKPRAGIDKAGLSQEIWQQAKAEHPFLDRYLGQARGLPKPAQGWPDSVRLHPNLPVGFSAGRPTPALLMRKTDRHGQICGLHAVFLSPDGSGKAAIDSPKKSFGSGGVIVIQRKGPKVLACEGPEDAISLAVAVPDATIICTAGSGTLNRVAEHIPTGTDSVVLIVDADEAGKVGAEKAARALAGLGVSVALAFPPNGTKDANAVLMASGVDAVRAMIEGATPWQASPTDASEPKRDWPFRVTPSGIEKRIERVDRESGSTSIDWKWFCSHLEIAAETRSAEGEEWGRLLQVTDRDGRTKTWAMPMSLLAGDGTAYRERLLSLGMTMAPGKFARDALHELVSTARPARKARCVGQVGWQGKAFIGPDENFGRPSDGDTFILQTSGPVDHAYRTKGRLEDWQREVARYAVGNSRLAFALAMAFTGPLLHPCAAESGGFHFRGGSSTGKTTALHVAGSACGGGGIRGYVRTWRATSNGLEGVAALHNDGLLCLDEMGQVGATEAGAISYMLANGLGKSRAGRSGEARRAAEWRMVFLSTGELTLADKLAEDGRGRRVAAGQEVRIVDIPADAGSGIGMFEHLHGFASGDAFSRHLRMATGEHYGQAWRAFMRRLVEDFDGIAPLVKGYVDDFLVEHCPSGADGQVSRVAARFGLVAAAGEIATGFGILPWQAGESSRAAGRCFRDWMAARGGSEPAEEREAVACVRRFIEMHGTSRFEALGDLAPRDANGSPIDQRISNRVGFRRRAESGGVEYLAMPEAWKSEVCAGLDATAVAKTLAARGLLAVGSDGKPQIKVRLPIAPNPVRAYVVKADILDGHEPVDTLFSTNGVY